MSRVRHRGLPSASGRRVRSGIARLASTGARDGRALGASGVAEGAAIIPLSGRGTAEFGAPGARSERGLSIITQEEN
ncbi:hypothetical protein IU433_15450 [Nocardia puris]|uniref:hypothetical protein n=1 Tax=Nocardia puris TaxID=208602 RepID=UPI0008320388|nr:hypothetical protein [Nocardia puris]MBF6214513.1 hypothetical protein [Nocardia puris]MBF6365922.1 hypothetical protein [Nocardia puris]MBF6460435.1 hypothetical protein [Nocardia puris]